MRDMGRGRRNCTIERYGKIQKYGKREAEIEWLRDRGRDKEKLCNSDSGEQGR